MIKKLISSEKIKGYLLVFMSLLPWSIHAVIISYLTFDIWISPTLMGFSSLFLWWFFLLLMWFIFFKNDFFNLVKKEKMFKNKLFMYSSFFLFLNFIFFHTWLKYTLASDSMMLETFSPVFAMMIALFLFPKSVGKMSNMKNIFFAILMWSFWSSLVMYNSPQMPWVEYSQKFFGDILQVLWMMFFAFFMVYNSELSKTMSSSWILMTWMWLILASIFMLPFAMSWLDSFSLFNEEMIYLLLLMSFWSTWMAYFTWFLASKYLNVMTLSILFNIISMTTVLMESIFYKNVDLISWKLVIWWLFMMISAVYIEFLNNTKKA